MEKRFAALEAELQGEKRKRQAETNALQAETKALREGLAKEEKTLNSVRVSALRSHGRKWRRKGLSLVTLVTFVTL